MVKSLKNASHVAQGKNINNAVVSSGEYWVCEDFVHVKKLSKMAICPHFVHVNLRLWTKMHNLYENLVYYSWTTR